VRTRRPTLNVDLEDFESGDPGGVEVGVGEGDFVEEVRIDSCVV
tara:strand:- start:447 stop:578 length:132 start_codon:yes stop_codon:yes gene_type:complete